MQALNAAFAAFAQADPGPFWAGVALMAVAAAALFVHGFTRLHHARLMENLPTSRLRSAAQGYVEVMGNPRLLPGPEIRSPLSATRCCWWQFRVERRRTVIRNGRRETRWETVEQGTSDDCFLLDDGTGTCVVDPVGARVIPGLSRRWRGYHPRPQRVPERSHWIALGDYRYTEQLIRLSDPLYALGQFRSRTAVRADHEAQDVAALLAQWKRDRPALLRRFDADGDGEVSLSEWETARRQAIEQVRGEQVARSVQPDLHVLSRPPDGRLFLLSARNEAQLTRRFRAGGLACVLLGVVVGAGVVLALIARGLLPGT